MVKKLYAILIVLSLLLWLSACSQSSEVSSLGIRFIDVGQGDSALVECDGHYMLIDGGDSMAANKVYNVLRENKVRTLDILVASHLHEDHIGGLVGALEYPTSIGLVLSNAVFYDSDAFNNLSRQLDRLGTQITVPKIGEKFTLGSAQIEVIDVSSEADNDCLVLEICYGDTKFLFTGDIEESAQERISDKYQNDSDTPYKVDLVKLPHHGSYTNTLYRFLRTFMPDYVVISVGADNGYGHPHRETLNLLESESWQPVLYRTDLHEDIFVVSDGKEVSVSESTQYRQRRSLLGFLERLFG